MQIWKLKKLFCAYFCICKCKRELESEPHLLSGQCEVFGDIRANYGDLKDDESLVRFLKEVLDMRDSIDEACKNWHVNYFSVVAVHTAPSTDDASPIRTSQPGDENPAGCFHLWNIYIEDVFLIDTRKAWNGHLYIDRVVILTSKKLFRRLGTIVLCTLVLLNNL